ncbi:MAG: hypothetical protein S4CHLAM123_05960 [Chlamydiales bacterium]|nr:hypothetical protein [Chlamydiales bacterium]
MAILKLLHVLFVFIWIGGLLALTRLLTYQAKELPETQLKLGKILKRMYYMIDLPSMILAVGFGLTLLFLKEMNWKAPWLHIKLTLAFFIIICDIICGYLITKHSKKPIVGRGIGYQILHGITGLLFIGVLVAIYILKNNA